MQILPLHPLLAAEIRDFSLDQFEESDWTRIIESLKKYSVLVFRNQEIDNEAQIRFSERLGPLETTKAGTDGAGTKLVFLTNMDSKGELLPVTSRAILNNRSKSTLAFRQFLQNGSRPGHGSQGCENSSETGSD